MTAKLPSYFIGVDAGGTHAVAVVVDASGQELARGRAAGAVAVRGAVAAAVDAVDRAARDALAAASLTAPIDALWAGVAGAGREDVRGEVEADLRGRGLAKHVGVGTDAEAALESVFGDGPGVLVVAGTGSIAIARSPDGRIARVGGWGAWLGDEGSAYWIAMQALGAVARAEDGRAQRTKLRAALLDHLSMDDPRELVAWVDRASKAELGALAPTILEVARAGDPVAASLATDAAAALRSHVLALLERLEEWEGARGAQDGGEPLTLALAGGLIGTGGPLRAVLERLLEPLGLSIEPEPVDAPLGAVRRVADAAGVAPPPRLAIASLNGMSKGPIQGRFETMASIVLKGFGLPPVRLRSSAWCLLEGPDLR